MPSTMHVVRAIAAAGLTLGLGTASAAEPIGSFARIDGVAVVSKGAQYVKAHEGMPLKEGDRLMVMEGGKAIIAFADGCQYTLADNEILTIGAVSTCASDAVGSYKVDPYTSVAQSQNTASAQFQKAAMGAPAAASAGGAAAAGSLAWVPLALVGAVGIAAAAGDSGGGGGIVLPPPSP